MMKLFLALFCSVWTIGVGSIACPEEPAWTDSITLLTGDSEEFGLKYVVDDNDSTITIEISAETTGWLAFGLGEETTGSMIGADIVSVHINDADGAIDVQDMHVEWSAYTLDTSTLYPVMDASCSDWVVVSGVKENGYTNVTLRRSLATGDPDDRDIIDGEMRIIYAFGLTPFVSYHGATRGSSAIDFRKPQSTGFTPPADVVGSLTLEMDKNNFPGYRNNSPTTYVCQAWELDTTTPRHIVAADIILDPDTKDFVHHVLVHVCKSSVISKWSTPDQCTSPTGSDCATLVYGWAVGGGPLVLPLEAGFLIGTGANDVRYVVVEIHYDIPGYASGLPGPDGSGVELYYTEILRTHNAASTVLGDPFTTFSNLPASTASVHREGVCPGSCTNIRLPNDGITVFSSFLHMHSFGRQIYTTKNGAIMNRADNWNFEFQQLTPVSYTINKGDELHTHCTFDTSKRTQSTVFGSGSLDEMCMDFLFYYPAQSNFGYCGYGKIQIGVQTYEGTVCSDELPGTLQEALDALSNNEVQLNNQQSDGMGFLASDFGTGTGTCRNPNPLVFQCDRDATFAPTTNPTTSAPTITFSPTNHPTTSPSENDDDDDDNQGDDDQGALSEQDIQTIIYATASVAAVFLIAAVAFASKLIRPILRQLSKQRPMTQDKCLHRREMKSLILTTRFSSNLPC